MSMRPNSKGAFNARVVSGGANAEYFVAGELGSRMRLDYMDREVVTYQIMCHELDELFASDNRGTLLALGIGFCSSPTWDFLRWYFQEESAPLPALGLAGSVALVAMIVALASVIRGRSSVAGRIKKQSWRRRQDASHDNYYVGGVAGGGTAY